MPEYIRVAIVVFFLAIATMLAMRKPAGIYGIDAASYRSYCATWLIVGASAFLLRNFWLFLLAVSLRLWFAHANERNPIALYFFLLFAVPPVAAQISGFGVLQHFFEISYSRLLGIFLLFPAYLRIRTQNGTSSTRLEGVDQMLFFYVALGLVLQLTVDTATNTLRFAFYAILDTLLPYFVISRYIVTTEMRRHFFIVFVMALILIAPIAVFEMFKGWLLFANFNAMLGLPPPQIPAYIGRGSFVRALATSGQPIVLGYLMVVAMHFHLAVDRDGSKARIWLAGLVVLLAGVVAPLSRGPWVGLLAGLFVMFLSSEKKAKLLVRSVVASLLILISINFSSGIRNAIEFLPFVGTVDTNNVDYRSSLIDVAWEVAWINPWFGSSDFLQHPAFKQLDQGGGAVDITNTFVFVLLTNGFVGLAAFIGVFLVAALRLMRAMSRIEKRSSEEYLQGRVLLSALIAVLVMIGTVSSIWSIPVVYWCLVGLMVGYARQMDASLRFRSAAKM